MQILSIISAAGIKSQLKNVQLLNKLRLGASFSHLVLSSRSSEITIKSSRNFSVGTCLFLPEPGKGPDYRDFKALKDGLASSSLSFPDHTELNPNGVSCSRRDVSADTNKHIIYDQNQPFHNLADLIRFITMAERYQLESEALLIAACKTYLKFENFKNESLSVSDKERLLLSVGMGKLCRVVEKHCSNLNAGNLIRVTSLFFYLNAPGTHPTFQILLRLLSEHTRPLSLTNIICLNFLLKQMSEISRSSLSEALALNLPITFKSQLDTQLKEANLRELIDCLRFAMETHAPEKTVKMILDRIVHRRMKLNYKQASSILRAVTVRRSKFNLPEISKIIDACFRIVENNIHFIELKELSLLLNTCGNVSQNRLFRDCNIDDFGEAACKRIVEAQHSDFKLVLSCFKKICFIKYVNLDICEYVAEIVLLDPKIILHDDSTLRDIVGGFSDANYKPEKWNALEPILLDHTFYCQKSSTQDIELAVDFLALNVLPTTLLLRIFSPDNFPNLESSYKRSLPFSLIMIHNALKHLHPEYNGPMPPTSMVEKWIAKNRELMDSAHANLKHLRVLKRALQDALRGDSYLVSGIVHEGVYIVGYPFAVQDRQSMKLEHIERPDQLILIRVYGTKAYSINTRRRLRGIFALESKIIAGFGLSVIEVDLRSFHELANSEQILWLRRQIRDRVDKVRSTPVY